MANGCAIVVGVGPQLGTALGRRFAAGGLDVALLARDADRLRRLAGEIAETHGVRAESFAADVADFDLLRGAIAEATEALGPVRALIYNVSVWREAEATELDPEALERDLRISASAALVASQAVLPAMRASGGGTILWTGGGLALSPAMGRPVPALTASKSAMRGLALAAAPSFRDAGINFATITIAGTIAAGTDFDPDRIADTFWEAHETPGKAERVFRGAEA